MRDNYKRNGLAALALVSSVLASAKVCSAEPEDDSLPAGAVARLGNRLFRHEGETYSLAFSPDKKLLAAGASDGKVYLWQTKTGKRVRCLAVGSLNCFPGIAFSPDGKQLVVHSYGELSFWDTVTGKKLFRRAVTAHLGYGPAAIPLCFSPDGKKLYVPAQAEDKKVGVLALDTTVEGKTHLLGATRDRIDSLTLSADGKTLALGLHDAELRGGAVVHLLDTATAKIIREFPSPKSSSLIVSEMAFSPDGNKVAWIGGQNRIILGDVKTGAQVVVPDITATQLVFMPDGKTLVSNGPEGKVTFWDLARKQRTRELGRRISNWRCLTLSHDGQFLAAGGSGCVVEVWDLKTGREMRSAILGHDEEVVSVVFNPDGKRLLSGDARQHVLLWDTGAIRSLRRWQTGGGRLAFSHDGKSFASFSRYWSGWTEEVDPVAHVWDVASGKERFKLPHEVFYTVDSLAFSLDDKFVLTADSRVSGTVPPPRQTELHIWDSATGRRVTDHSLYKGETAPRGVFSEDGRTLAFGGLGDRCPVRIWSVPDKRETLILQGQKRWLPLALSADGKLLATRTWEAGPLQPDWENAIYLWETATGKEVLAKPLDGGLSLAFSPNGRFTAVAPDGWASARGVKRDRSYRICLYDPSSGKEVRQLRPESGHVASLAFSPDGSRLASGLGDGTVLLWDVSDRMAAGRAKGDLTPEELRQRWADLAGDDARKAYQAIWILSDHPRQANPYIRERIAPVVMVEASHMNKLIADLDSDLFVTRERAGAELEKLLDAAEPALRQALRQKPTLEARRRIEQILAKLDSRPLASERLRALRAVTVLERTGDADARHILTKLAAGQEDVRLTQEAKAALQRLRTR